MRLPLKLHLRAQLVLTWIAAVQESFSGQTRCRGNSVSCLMYSLRDRSQVCVQVLLENFPLVWSMVLGFRWLVYTCYGVVVRVDECVGWLPICMFMVSHLVYDRLSGGVLVVNYLADLVLLQAVWAFLNLCRRWCVFVVGYIW